MTQNDLYVNNVSATLNTRNSIIIEVLSNTDNVSHTHLINLSPGILFTDPDSRVYTLKSGSPAINASEDVTSGEPQRDLAGNERAGNGSAYDCGAYEFIGASPASMPYADAADAAFLSLGEDDLAVDFDQF